MQFDISVDTEALVVDAYPKMRECQSGVNMDELDAAWGFYGAMIAAHPEMMTQYRTRIMGMVKAVRDIERAAGGRVQFWTDEEIEEDRAIQLNAAMRGCGGITKEK